MNRFEEKLLLAAQVVPDQTKLLEADADKLIARGNEFSSRRTKTFAAHHAVLDSGDKGMDALDAQLALVTNDPLPSSGGSQEWEPDPTKVIDLNGDAATNPVLVPMPLPAPTFDPLTVPSFPPVRAVPSRRDL